MATKRNRWLKKQARRLYGLNKPYVRKRIRAMRKAYAMQLAKYIHENQVNKIPFPELLPVSSYDDISIALKLAIYTQGKQDEEAYKKAFGTSVDKNIKSYLETVNFLKEAAYDILGVNQSVDAGKH